MRKDENGKVYVRSWEGLNQGEMQRTGRQKEMETSDFHKRIRKRRQETNRRFAALFLGIAVLVLAFSFFFAMQFEAIQRQYLYPYPYRSDVEHYAAKYEIDSSLVAGVILSESKFKNDAKSHRGAVGLMQLMPETAVWISEQMDDTSYSLGKLHEPKKNIEYGTWYLASLEREFDGNDILALAAYNAGRGNVHDWMEEMHWGMDFHEVSAIPYEETRAYVVSVLKNRRKYLELYGNGSD